MELIPLLVVLGRRDVRKHPCCWDHPWQDRVLPVLEHSFSRREEAEAGTEQDGKGGSGWGHSHGSVAANNRVGACLLVDLYFCLNISTNQDKLYPRGITGSPTNPQDRTCLGLAVLYLCGGT